MWSKIKATLKGSVSVMSALILVMMTLAPAAGLLVSETAYAAPICSNDSLGANDVPGQKDLTKLCIDTAGLPTSLAGQLIVFETLSALGYAFVLRGQMPVPLTLIGVALLIAGVAFAVRLKAVPVAMQDHSL